MLIDGLAEIESWAEAALHDPDPWAGLSGFLIAFTEAQLARTVMRPPGDGRGSHLSARRRGGSADHEFRGEFDVVGLDLLAVGQAERGAQGGTAHLP